MQREMEILRKKVPDEKQEERMSVVDTAQEPIIDTSHEPVVIMPHTPPLAQSPSNTSKDQEDDFDLPKPPPKTKRQLNSHFIEKELSHFRLEHNTATDEAQIDEYFHSHSHLSDLDGQTRYLDEDHTLAAIDELFSRWEFTVTPE